MKGVADLIPYKNNPRKNDCAVDAVAASIRDFGFKQPIVIDADNVVICGDTRLKAAKKNGYKEVPCIIASDLSPEQAKAYRLADNKVGELAEWDWNILPVELAGIPEFNPEEYGFDATDDTSAEEYGTDFSLPDDDVPQARTITLTLCEQQYQTCMKVIEYFSDGTSQSHDFGNKNKRSNALFEAVYRWAQQNNLL